jgi:4-diphosphocytidyl-2-C-methyl-D-erythritol kinase
LSGAILRVGCPAKVNLLLRVLFRREDGYHELDTVFQALELRDRLSIEAGPDLSLECTEPSLPMDEDNLVLRAARLLVERHGSSRLGARLVLHKSIPLQAGLGGGSSDAAAALILCNRHWDLGLAAGQLGALAAELGADVPFFLTGGTARGRGRGDRIEPLPFVGETSVVLGFPPFGIPTAEVFGRVAARLTLPGNGVSVRLPSALKWREGKDFGFLANDLEPVVFEGWPELEGFRDALLEAGAGAALLSGSGSTVYGVFQGPELAARAALRVQPRFTRWRVLTTRFVRDGIRWESTAIPGEEA